MAKGGKGKGKAKKGGGGGGGNKRGSYALERRARNRRGVQKGSVETDMVQFRALGQQVQYLGMKMRDVRGDGNCLFRSISDQFMGEQTYHLEIRMMVVEHMMAFEDLFKPFVVDEEWDSYVARMSRDGTYGTHLELQAICQKFYVNLLIHKLNQPMWEINNFGDKSPTFQLGYFDEHEHYASVRHADENRNAMYHLPRDFPIHDIGNSFRNQKCKRKKSVNQDDESSEQDVMTTTPRTERTGTGTGKEAEAIDVHENVVVGFEDIGEFDGGCEEGAYEVAYGLDPDLSPEDEQAMLAAMQGIELDDDGKKPDEQELGNQNDTGGRRKKKKNSVQQQPKEPKTKTLDDINSKHGQSHLSNKQRQRIKKQMERVEKREENESIPAPGHEPEIAMPVPGDIGKVIQI